MADDQPTPPENPFESAGDNGTHATIENGDAGNGLPQGAPNVAAKAGKTYIVLGVVGLVVVLLIYSILGGKDKKEVKDEPNKVQVAPKPPDPPPLPQKDPVVDVKPPDFTQLPPIPDPVKVPDVVQQANPLGTGAGPLSPKEDAAAKAQQMARLRSPIMLKDGGSSLTSALTGQNPAAVQGDSNAQFASKVANTKAERVEATRIGDLRRTIAAGRIIQATMESALNTDLEAPIRAIVSLDTYGEAGTVPLIPKGSRLIGKYNSKVENGQTRVFVLWTRIIRPDGVDIQLGAAPLIDAIGQAGVAGQLDTKFQEIFARSLVSSVMNIATAIGSDKITGGTTTTTNSPDGGSQTSGDAATTATTNALNRLGNTTDTFLQKFLQVPPTILVDQGTKVNVFVNKDLVFPDDMAGVSIIQ